VSNEYDIVVAGGGIAGLTAGLTAARLGRRTMVLTGDVLGGQLLSIEKVEGFPGHPEGIAGYDLCPMAQEAAAAAGAEFAPASLQTIAADDERWRLATSDGEFSARAVILASGTSLQELGLPAQARLHGKGVSHCATCDGPLMRNRVLVVVGGGDSAMQEALTLAQFGSRVVMIERGGSLTGQTSYRQRVAENKTIEVRLNTTVEDILGDAAVSGVRLRDNHGNLADLECAGVFVYIGLKPNTAFLKDFMALTPSGHIRTDEAMRTGHRGIAAAGTVRAGAPGRAVSAAGDGSAAAIAADRYLTGGWWSDSKCEQAAGLPVKGD
jgi:thioredoxin reductase (NADPH)